MNLVVKYIITIAAFFLFSASFTCAQKIKEITHRDISVHYSDSSINATVLIEEKGIKSNTNIDYYWYQNNAIKVNQGGYKGKLLDGDYQVTTVDGNLVTKGEFKKGYKISSWKTWKANGELAAIYHWNMGYKNGNYQLYVDGKVTEKGSYKLGKLHGAFLKYEAEQLVEKGAYKNSKLHGKIIVYKNDTIFSITKYKNGKEIMPKEKPTKTSKIIKEKNKKNTTENAVENTKEEKKETNKKGWKFWKKKTKNEEDKKQKTEKVKEPRLKEEKKIKKNKDD